VWPVIRPWLGGGELYPVEAVTTTEAAKDLDIFAGIDAWHVQRDRGRMRGIASRVQWTPAPFPPFKTFTIRTARRSHATELEKRLAQLNSDGGWLLPAITVQGYIRKADDGALLYCCCIETKSLFSVIEKCPEVLSDPIENNDGSSSFQYVQVWKLKQYGCNVKEYVFDDRSG